MTELLPLDQQAIEAGFAVRQVMAKGRLDSHDIQQILSEPYVRPATDLQEASMRLRAKLDELYRLMGITRYSRWLQARLDR